MISLTMTTGSLRVQAPRNCTTLGWCTLRRTAISDASWSRRTFADDLRTCARVWVGNHTMHVHDACNLTDGNGRQAWQMVLHRGGGGTFTSISQNPARVLRDASDCAAAQQNQRRIWEQGADPRAQTPD